MKYIFLDTMVFLHYRIFSEIDFLALFGNESTTIVILEVVAHEIDNHKENNDRKKVRTRARRVSGKILQAIKGGTILENKLYVKFCPLNNIDLTSMGFSAASNDHRIIGAIIDFATKIDKTKDSILFITHDIASTITAEARGIVVKTLPNEFKLAEEPDESEKELQLLRKENAELKSASPCLVLRVNGTLGNVVNIAQDSFKRFIVPKYTPLENIIENFQEAVLPVGYKKESCPEKLLGPFNMMGVGDKKLRIARENADIYRYNRDREQYFKEYKEYIERIKERKKSLYAKICLFIENIGSKPAEGVDVYLHFPNGFDMFSVDEFPEELALPREPLKPRTSNELLLANIQTPYINMLSHNFPRLPKAVTKSFSLNKTNSYEFNTSAKIIKHGSHAVYDLPVLYLWYKDISEIKNFSMEYRLSANNIPMEISGKIIFKFDCSNLKEETNN